MKLFVNLVMSLVVVGCSSSSDDSENSANPLLGTWRSNCHEFPGTESETGDVLYNTSEITFTETEYVDNFITYTDINCTSDPLPESSVFNYVVGEMVPTTDGVAATRITLTAVIPDRPDLSPQFEAIYRISNVDLNFGEYTEGEIPTIDTGVTYIKQ